MVLSYDLRLQTGDLKERGFMWELERAPPLMEQIGDHEGETVLRHVNTCQERQSPGFLIHGHLFWPHLTWIQSVGPENPVLLRFQNPPQT